MDKLNYILYIAFFMGLLLFTGRPTLMVVGSFKSRIKKTFGSEKRKDSVSNNGKVNFTDMTKSILGIKNTKLLAVMVLTVCMVVIGFLWDKVPKSTAIFSGALLSILPYILIASTFKGRQVKTSMEGDILVSEILNCYKTNYSNIHEALTEAIGSMTDGPYSRKLIINLVMELNIASSSSDVRNATNDFNMGIGTTWSRLLANNIFYAQTMGINITIALEDLLESIRKGKKAEEYSKRENNEAKLILKWLAPVSYVLTVAGACKFFGFTLRKFVVYQFLTPLGLQWFLIVVCFYIIGIIMALLLTTKKMDI